jgi:archaellum component FlaC
MFKVYERKEDEERRISELKSEERYLDMCKRYEFQDKNLKAIKQELGEVKQKLEETQEELEGLTQRENVWKHTMN